MSKNTFTFSASTSEFVQGWVVSAICQAAFKGIETSNKNISDNSAKAREILEARSAHKESDNAELNKLKDWTMRNREQIVEYKDILTTNKAKYKSLTGKPWSPYNGNRNSGEEVTDATSFWAEELGLEKDKAA